MTAIEARQQVQAAIDALVETPRDVEDGLIRILEQVVGLLRSPHPYDAGQKGRTLSFGIDALRAWCAAWEALNVSDTHGFGGADVWHELCLRIVEIFNLPLFSGSQRMRTLTMRMCARFDTMGCASLPPFASMLLDEANKSECQAQFMIQEALLAHYGMRILSKPPSEFYMHVLHGIQQGFGHISRRSHLAITFMEHAPINDWLETLARVLCTSEDRGIEHLVAHVVHPWLDRKPEALQPMLDALKEERAKMYVLQAAKMHHLCVVEEMVPGKVRIPIDMLQTCLASSSSRMRVGALSLCVEARTPSMLLTLPERQMILQFFQHCLHLSSAVARKDTIALFVKLLVRIRTSCHKMKDQRVQEMQHFLHSLYQYMVHAMHPGAPYPSTILGVSLLFLLFEATTPPKETSPLPLLHESVLRDAVRALYKAQKTYPATALAPIAASGPLMHRLLYLATESTYDDVQSTAALILLRRSSHANSFWDDREFVWQHIVSKSWQLLTAPKESDAHAGLQLLKLYHKACVPDMHEFLLIRMGGKACGDWTCSLMDVHAGRLEAQLDEAKESFAHASHKGIHGTVAALAYLAEAADTVPLQRMHDLIQRVWTLVSPYLCAAAPENAEAEEEDQVHESPVSQRILSFSWRAMKEVAALHEVCALSHMTEDTVQEASDLFLTWLLSIRHRGAFSMVYPRYHGMARAICEQGGHGPDAWLKACMERVDRDASQFSTTRRSAGLGYAVLALLSAHKGKKLMDLTASTMRRLLSMAMGHECIRTIHALNVMRVLVMDSSIASAMRSHLGEALACAVTSFRSVHWSVRNAAMMLFSAISTRYFGTSAFGRRANMRGAKLETLWRESDALADALQSTLGTCMQDQDADEGHGSALYAVLCLFSRSDASMCTDTMLDMLYRCRRSKHAAVRTLAAQCCATLTPAEQRYDTGARLLREASTRDQNALAGALAILEHWASPVYKEMVLSRMDLLEENACPVTMASFLQVAERCGAQGHVRPWLLSWLEKTKPQDPFMAWFLPVACRMVWDALPMSLLQGPDRAMMIGMLSAEPELIARMPWDQHDVVNMLEDVLWDAQMPLQARTQAAHVLDMLHASLDAQALLTLCLSTEHVPLREALLPLLGRAVQPDTLEPCLWILDACAKEEAPRASRLGVARALARMEETSHVRKDVLVIRLLHDDDPDVREAACALCDTSDRVMKRGPDACTQDLWQKHLHEPAFQAYVWQMLVPTTSTREDDPSLFPTEAANQYHDAVSDVLRAFRVCMTLAPHPHLRVWADEARGHLDRDVDLVRPGAYLMHLQRACLVRLAWAAGLLDDMSWVLRVCRDRLLLPPMDEWGLSEEPGEPTSPPSVGPLRIALLSDFFFPNVGGVERHMYMIGQHLIRRGHKVIVITHAYSPDRVGIRYLSAGIKVYYVPYGVLVRQDTLPNFFGLMPVLRSILIRERIQIVHAHQALSSMAHEGLFHAKCLGLKAVFTDHSLFGFADVGSILTNKLLRFALTDVDHVVCVSHTGRENTVLRAALHPENVSTIPNAVDAHQLYPDPAPCRDGGICVVVLSRLMYRKGIDLLLEAIPPLCEQHPDVRFVIGGDGPKYVELEQMRERHMLQDRVELVGAVRQRDIRAHLTRGQLFLNTSLTEAFGTTIIEATCAGLYVVTTKVGGIPELLPPSMMRLAEPCAEAIVDAMSHAIEYIRSGKHDAMAQHQRVASMYSWAETTQRLETVYARAMAAPQRSATERFQRYLAVGGPVGGPIICLVVAAQMILALILEWVIPDASIPRVP